MTQNPSMAHQFTRSIYGTLTPEAMRVIFEEELAFLIAAELLPVTVVVPTSEQRDILFRVLNELYPSFVCRVEQVAGEYMITISEPYEDDGEKDIMLNRDGEEIEITENGGMQSKVQLDWTLLAYDGLEEMVRIMTENCAAHGGSYPVNNWRKISRLDHIRHAMNHMTEVIESLYATGGEADVMKSLAHAGCRIMFALSYLNEDADEEEEEDEITIYSDDYMTDYGTYRIPVRLYYNDLVGERLVDYYIVKDGVCNEYKYTMTEDSFLSNNKETELTLEDLNLEPESISRIKSARTD